MSRLRSYLRDVRYGLWVILQALNKTPLPPDDKEDESNASHGN